MTIAVGMSFVRFVATCDDDDDDEVKMTIKRGKNIG